MRTQLKTHSWNVERLNHALRLNDHA